MKNHDRIKPRNSFLSRDGSREEVMTSKIPWPWSQPCEEAQSVCLPGTCPVLSFHKVSGCSTFNSSLSWIIFHFPRSAYGGCLLVGRACCFGIRSEFFPALTLINYMALGCYWAHFRIKILRVPGSWDCRNDVTIALKLTVLCARNWFQHLMCMTSFTPPNETVMLFPLPPLYKWVNKVQREATSPVRGHTVRGRTKIWINLGSLASTPLCLIIPPNYFPVLYCLF